MQKTILRNLIKNINNYDETLNVLFLDPELNLYSKCILITDEQVENKRTNTIIGLYLIKDILDNLSFQKENYTEQEAIDAIKFYLQHDAFIET